jgi:trans-aconitate methyltransferase
MAGDALHWDRVYGTKAEDAVSWFEADVSRDVALIERHAPSRDTAIVDVGSGLTRLVPALVAAGYHDVTALDLSAEGIARARARPGLGTVAWVVADVTRWVPPRRYGVWHDRAVLHFLTEEADRSAYRRALIAGIGPGSLAILAAFGPEGPERCSGLPVRRYGRADFEDWLGGDFTTLEAFGSVHRTPSGAHQAFQTIVVRRSR